MNLVEFLKEAIVKNRYLQNHYANMYHIFDRIECDIQQAWEIWDDNILKSYYNGEKPEEPTDEFAEQWIENEDFEADWLS